MEHYGVFQSVDEAAEYIFDIEQHDFRELLTQFDKNQTHNPQAQSNYGYQSPAETIPFQEDEQDDLIQQWLLTTDVNDIAQDIPIKDRRKRGSKLEIRLADFIEKNHVNACKALHEEFVATYFPDEIPSCKAEQERQKRLVSAETSIKADLRSKMGQRKQKWRDIKDAKRRIKAQGNPWPEETWELGERALREGNIKLFTNLLEKLKMENKDGKQSGTKDQGMGSDDPGYSDDTSSSDGNARNSRSPQNGQKRRNNGGGGSNNSNVTKRARAANCVLRVIELSMAASKAPEPVAKDVNNMMKDSVMGAMKAFPMDADIQMNGCCALKNLEVVDAKKNVEDQLRSKKAMELIIKLLKAPELKVNFKVHRETCKAISVFLKRGHLSTEFGIEIATHLQTLMQDFKDQELMQNSILKSWMLLTNTVFANNINKLQEEYNLVDIVTTLMNSHIRNNSIAQLSLSLLAKIAKVGLYESIDKAERDKLGNHLKPAMEIVSKVMDFYCKEEEIVTSACEFITSVAMWASTQRRFLLKYEKPIIKGMYWHKEKAYDTCAQALHAVTHSNSLVNPNHYQENEILTEAKIYEDNVKLMNDIEKASSLDNNMYAEIVLSKPVV
eukprot:m.114375 g.114375  ORF g.114375 m.114375 type:complete len:612 (+) comp14163_c0_seq3:37-1872(+)